MVIKSDKKYVQKYLVWSTVCNFGTIKNTQIRRALYLLLGRHRLIIFIIVFSKIFIQAHQEIRRKIK